MSKLKHRNVCRMQNINEELSGRIQTIINQTMYEKIELMQNC